MKFVNSILMAAYLIIVGLTAWSLVQSFGVKEVSVEAEVKEILSVEYPGRSETDTTLLCSIRTMAGNTRKRSSAKAPAEKEARSTL
ncbi:hypothetical protein [Blautia wexlerae]|uniref:hypothetical protein n=1 Tax=Blautia wexlerae TaxID=418240 RepID=UPI0034A3E5DF